MKTLGRFFLVALFLTLALSSEAKRAKYVFYFIGDGMGLNQVGVTEMFMKEMQGNIGITPLSFTSFPAAGMAYTFSGTNSITDSSAGGTALSTGRKTYNGAIGVDINKTPIKTIAEVARDNGKKVGVVTSVSVDHATPACFYAHQKDRNMYYEIAQDLSLSKFDFFAGGGFLKPNTTSKGTNAPSIYAAFNRAGYYVAKGLLDYEKKAKITEKMILLPSASEKATNLSYAIDRGNGNLTLADETHAAIDFLTKGNEGFFLMVEGGQIDWACHKNDAGTMVREVIDFDEAIKEAISFYEKHPKQTLIVVTADHETGGLGLGSGDYTLHLKKIGNQKCSMEMLERKLSQLSNKNKALTWNEVKTLLENEVGFWKSIELTKEQETLIKEEFEQVQLNATQANWHSLVRAVCSIMSKVSHLGWTSGGHTAGYVPVYAIGCGQERFQGKLNNTDIAPRIASAAGYKW